jgi:stage IV sporulation protein FA
VLLRRSLGGFFFFTETFCTRNKKGDFAGEDFVRPTAKPAVSVAGSWAHTLTRTFISWYKTSDKQVMRMTSEWNLNNKRRRRERIRLIREGAVSSGTFSPDLPEVWKMTEVMGPAEPLPWNRISSPSASPGRARLIKQGLGAAALFAITFLVFQSSSPAIQPVESFTREVMTRDFNFAGTAEWAKRVMGESPSILPAFRPQTGSRISATGWTLPAKGRIALPFDNKRKGVVIRTKAGGPVTAAAEGWVVFSGTREGLGHTVIIRHAGGLETWYGWLKAPSVRTKDWVKPGQKLGEPQETGGQSLLYFAVKKNGRFVDPASVISFE